MFGSLPVGDCRFAGVALEEEAAYKCSQGRLGEEDNIALDLQVGVRLVEVRNAVALLPFCVSTCAARAVPKRGS